MIIHYGTLTCKHKQQQQQQQQQLTFPSIQFCKSRPCDRLCVDGFKDNPEAPNDHFERFQMIREESCFHSIALNHFRSISQVLLVFAHHPYFPFSLQLENLHFSFLDSKISSVYYIGTTQVKSARRTIPVSQFLSFQI